MNPIANPNPLPPNPSSYFSYFSQNPNSQFSLLHASASSSSASSSVIGPPGVDSYRSLTPLSQPLTLSYAQIDAAGYYVDPTLQNWVAKEAVRQYGSDPTGCGGAVSVGTPQDGTQQLAVAVPGAIAWNNFALQLQANGTWKKLRQKKTKVVQSAYCEVCKLDCNSKEVLDQHKLGKKHKKNLEKLQATGAGLSTSSGLRNPVIGPQQAPNKGKTGNVQRGKKKVVAPAEDLETKRRKVVNGGAAAEAVRVCAICNVVCNSESVYNFHLSGRKHAAMLKKHGVIMVAAT